MADFLTFLLVIATLAVVYKLLAIRRAVVVLPSTGCDACDTLLNAGVKITRDAVPPSCYSSLQSKGLV